MPHPQCLCAQWAVIPDSLEDIGARIGAWASGEPDAVLDEWYDKYGNRNQNGDPKEILRGNGGELLQNAAGSGRIKTERKSIYHQVTKKSLSRIPMVHISEDEETNRQYHKALKSLLRAVMNSGTKAGTEFSCVLDMDMNPIGKIVRGYVSHVTIDNPDEKHHAIHNHGSDKTFNTIDIKNMLRRDSEQSISVIGNRGSYYGMFALDNADRDGYMSYLQDKSEDVIFSVNGYDFTISKFEQMTKGEVETPAFVKDYQEQLISAIESKTDEILEGCADYGFRYIKIPAVVVN